MNVALGGLTVFGNVVEPLPPSPKSAPPPVTQKMTAPMNNNASKELDFMLITALAGGGNRRCQTVGPPTRMSKRLIGKRRAFLAGGLCSPSQLLRPCGLRFQVESICLENPVIAVHNRLWPANRRKTESKENGVEGKKTESKAKRSRRQD